MSFHAELGHDKQGVHFLNNEIANNTNGASLTMTNVVGKSLADAKRDLERVGFINIREEPYSDIFVAGNWRVDTQNITAGTKIDKNTPIVLNCTKFDDYYNRLFAGHTLAEAQALANQGGYRLYYVDTDHYESMDEMVNGFTESQKNNYLVKTAIKYVGEDYAAELTVYRKP